ncbi:MAG: phosphoserine phosphatase SerB [Alphaproteobacteria bacterium]|nr:phosphoserine phosphatase SerB [Alphaproteobacteria bacterium]
MAVVTLIAPPGETALTQEWVAHLSAALQAKGCALSATDWLAPDEAVDCTVQGAEADILLVVEAVAAGMRIDAVLHDGKNRRKTFLLADMESTIIEQEMLDEMAEVVDARPQVADITRRAMNGELDFIAAVKERVLLFKGQPESLLADMAKRMTYTPGARALTATMARNGAKCWLVSGGFRVFTRIVAAALGFEREFGNEFVVTGGALTGGVREPILDKDAKLATLQLAASELGVDPAKTIAVGDGANDLPMLLGAGEAGGFGVAFHAKPSVNASVRHRIRHCDLTALLYLQGYRKAEFVA